MAARLHANLAQMPAVEFPRPATRPGRWRWPSRRATPPSCPRRSARSGGAASTRPTFPWRSRPQRQLGAARAAANQELEIDAEINLLETAWYLGDREARGSGLRAVRRLAQSLRMPWYEGVAAMYEVRERIVEGNLPGPRPGPTRSTTWPWARGQSIGGVYGAQRFAIISLQDRESEFEPVVRSMVDAVSEELLIVDVSYRPRWPATTPRWGGPTRPPGSSPGCSTTTSRPPAGSTAATRRWCSA